METSTESPRNPPPGGHAPAQDAGARSLLRSPGLAQFRVNPFRVLRLPTDVAASQAVWKAEKALARVRAGVALPEPDLTPWLPAADELEIQQAAQKMEEPLRRLHDQLLWFDMSDPHGQLLSTALAAGDANQLRFYLAIDERTFTCAPEALYAHRLNQANLRLLLAFSWLAGVGPELDMQAGGEAPVPRLDFAPLPGGGGAQAVLDAHQLLGREVARGRASAWPMALPQALTRWAVLLGDQHFAGYVRAQIARLGDELVGEGDVEPLISALRTSLADLVVGELKLRIVNGRVDAVAELSMVAAQSGFDRSVWQLAFRPLKPLIAGELDELETLIDERKPSNLADISQYLARVSALAESWARLDQSGLLGLGDVVDDAVQRAFLRIRVVENPGQRINALDETLAIAGELARTTSLKERISAYRTRLKAYKEDLCYYCGKREAEAKSCAAVSGRVETHRTRGYNSTTIHYRISSVPVARCPRCAELHAFVRKMGSTGWWVGIAVVGAGLVLFGSELFGGRISIGSVLLLGVAVFVMWLIAAAVREVGSRKVVPRGERSFSAIEASPAMLRLKREGFSGIQYDWRPDAWVRISEQGQQPHTGDGAGASALKAVGWIVVVIVLIALRVGCR